MMEKSIAADRHGAGFKAAVKTIAGATDEALAAGSVDHFSEDDIAIAMAALGRLYSAKVERSDKTFPPVTTDALTATQTVVLVSALLRAADLNVFDLAMWFRRAS